MHVFLLDNPEVTLTKTDLDNLGVLSWVIPVDTLEQDGILDGICKERKYTYKDIVRQCNTRSATPLRLFCALVLTHALTFSN